MAILVRIPGIDVAFDILVVPGVDVALIEFVALDVLLEFLLLTLITVIIAFIGIALFLPNNTLIIPLVMGEGTLVSIPVAPILKSMLLLPIMLFIRIDYDKTAFLATSLFNPGTPTLNSVTHITTHLPIRISRIRPRKRKPQANAPPSNCSDKKVAQRSKIQTNSVYFPNTCLYVPVRK